MDLGLKLSLNPSNDHRNFEFRPHDLIDPLEKKKKKNHPLRIRKEVTPKLLHRLKLMPFWLSAVANILLKFTSFEFMYIHFLR